MMESVALAKRHDAPAILISCLRHPWRWTKWLFAAGDRQAANLQRWSDLGNFDPGWDERTRRIAARCAGAGSVIEFGAGRGTLAAELEASTHYTPSDIVSRGPDTLVWDLNKGAPVLDRHYDVAVFSGVLEYVGDIGLLFRGLHGQVGRIVASYASTEEVRDRLTRLENGWVNHSSSEDFIAIAAESGFAITDKEEWVDSSIYAFRSNASR
jgi:hypothetical protein